MRVRERFRPEATSDVRRDRTHALGFEAECRRDVARDAVRTLIGQHITQRQFGVFGEPRVNVLELNLALDKASK